jgi:signal transduction histidine kinase
VLLSLLVLLPAWYLLGNWYQSNLIQQERAKAAEQISARANALVLAVDQRIALLQGLYAFTRTEWPDTEFDLTFEIYSAGIYFNTTGVRTLMIAPEGIARYIFPISDAPELSGYDILHDPDPARRANVQRAIHSRAITLSQPGELRQGGFGLTAWEAVYRGKDLWGLVSIAVDLNTILKDAGLIGPSGELDMSLQDSTGRTFFGPQALWQRDPVVQSIALPEGAWALGGAPQGGWQAAVRDQANVFRAGSLLIVALISLIVYLTVNRQGQLREAVALRTRQIAAAQLALEQRVQERTQELDALQDVSRRIGSTLALDPLLRQILAEIKPVLDYTSAFIFWLDESGGLKLLNAAGEARSAGEGPDFSPVYEGLLEEVRESLQPRIEWDWAGGEGALVKGCRMGVPLVIKDRLNGLLVLVHPEPHFYEEEEARLALAFAQQIAVAIEKARLYEQAGRLAVLEERQRLARELHDSVSQVLYSIGLGAKTAQTALRRDPSQSAEALDYVNRLAEAGQVEMHALIFELRPESLRTEGLVTALERQAAVLRARHQITVQARFCPEPGVPLEVKETLYRVSQEAMHNIVKHAQASQVSLALACSEKQICLEVSDNGVGFDPAAPRPGHLGLRSMHERAVRYQGQVLIDSAPGRGTRVTFVIPLKGGN